jgi:hypothetical protein
MPKQYSLADKENVSKQNCNEAKSENIPDLLVSLLAACPSVECERNFFIIAKTYLSFIQLFLPPAASSWPLCLPHASIKQERLVSFIVYFI